MKFRKIFIYFLVFISSLTISFNVWTYSLVFYLIENKKLNLILPFLGLVAGGYAFFSIVTYIKTKSINKYIMLLMKEQKLKVFKNILYKNSDETNDVSDNLSLILNDFKFIEDNYYLAEISFFSSVVSGLGALLFALYNNWLLTLIFVSFGIIPILTSNINQKYIKESSKKWADINQKLTNYAKDFFKNKLAIKVYDSVEIEMKNVNNLLEDLEYSNADKKNQVAYSTMISSVIGYTIFFTPIIIGIYLVIKGYLSISNFVAVQYSNSWIINYFMNLIQIRNQIKGAKPVQEKIQKILNEVPEIESMNQSNKIKTIEFRDVSFKFKEKEIFDNINLTINEGDKILIKGESGTGKTTFLKLLLKIIEPTSGDIYINGKNTKSMSSSEMMSYFGLINQNPFIFNDTILKNITFGIEFSKDEIEKAIREAGLESLIEEKGYEYIVGEDGKLLSGGQLKRLDIARAILFGRSGILVDELNASLDENTAKNINEILLKSDKTILDIEHHIFGKEEDYTKKILLKDKKLIIE